MPIRQITTAPQPSRRRPRCAVQRPNMAPTMPTRSDQTIERASIGGIVRTHANTPSRTPTTPVVLVDMSLPSAAECTCSTRTLMPWPPSCGACGASSRRRG